MPFQILGLNVCQVTTHICCLAGGTSTTTLSGRPLIPDTGVCVSCGKSAPWGSWAKTGRRNGDIASVKEEDSEEESHDEESGEETETETKETAGRRQETETGRRDSKQPVVNTNITGRTGTIVGRQETEDTSDKIGSTIDLTI
eukprot:Platyproteum_vivax@DN4837_c0_g1_i2.p1